MFLCTDQIGTANSDFFRKNICCCSAGRWITATRCRRNGWKILDRNSQDLNFEVRNYLFLFFNQPTYLLLAAGMSIKM